MLLNKIKKIIVLIGLLVVILPFVYSQQECTAAEIKDALRKALFEYFEAPADSKLSVNEIKDFLHYYLSLDTSQLAVDCSSSGPLSGKPYYLMLGAARNIQRGIPTCGDGTEYGKCSSNTPNYCYGGRLEERCKMCGCGQNTVCDAKTNKCAPSETPIEPIPPIQTLPNPPQINSIGPSSGLPDTKITLTGTGFTETGNSINWGNQFDAIRELSSPDGKTLTFYALQMQCPRNSCLVSVTNVNGNSNSVTFNLTHRPAKKTHKGPPNVKVLTPNGGERYVYGRDKINITWSGGRDSVVLYVMGRMSASINEQNEFEWGIDNPIAKDLPPSGSFEWDGKVCLWSDMNACRQTYPGFLKILAISKDKPGEQLTPDTVYDPEHDNWDESDNPFLLVTPATISSLQVTSPNGEEKWIQEKNEYPWSLPDVGTWAPFEWKTFSFAPNNYFVPYYPTLSGQVYSINLLKGGKLYRTMSSGFMYQSQYWNLSSYHFTFPYYVKNASDYTVEVVFHGPNGDIKDVSDNVFSIGIVPGVVAVRGRPVDKFTGAVGILPDGYYSGIAKIYPGTRKDGSKFHPIPAYWGAFVFGMATDDVSLSTQKALYSLDYHISNLPIAISKKSDNTFEAVIGIMDQNPQPLRFNAVDSDANLLIVSMWTAAHLSLATDVPVTYSVEYAQDGLSFDGSIATIKPTNQWNYNWYWENYGLLYNNLGWLIPLNYDTRVKLVDGSGKTYYSPNINLGLEYTNRGASIIFKNGTVKWSIPPNVQVIYPDRGVYWKTGTTQTIQWKYVNAPANYNPQVSVYLAGTGSTWVEYTFPASKLIATTRGTSYNWTIPSDIYGYYRILVIGEPYSVNYIRDYSDYPFWISS